MTDTANTADNLDSILEVACEVLSDYAGEDQDTRISRMARYLVARLGSGPYQLQQAGQLFRASIRDGRAAWRSGNIVGFGSTSGIQWPTSGIDANVMEEYLVALVRLIESAPRDSEDGN